jgi:hypothetical protein
MEMEMDLSVVSSCILYAVFSFVKVNCKNDLFRLVYIAMPVRCCTASGAGAFADAGDVELPSLFPPAPCSAGGFVDSQLSYLPAKITQKAPSCRNYAQSRVFTLTTLF